MRTVADLEELGITVVRERNNEAHCLCPVHADKDPSFFFNLRTEKFHCFAGCLKGAGLHQLRFQLTGVRTGEPDIVYHSPLAKVVEEYRPLPHIPVLPLAIGNEGEAFLTGPKRRFTTDTIREWALKWWAEERAVVIPIPDIGFIKRYVDATETKNKYQYVTGTKITSGLFGAHKFNDTKAVLVEGAFDAIWLHQCGITQALATLHPDISQRQFHFLLGSVSAVYVMMDSDKGGDEGAQKIIKKLKRSFLIRRCRLPDGKDPNDCESSELWKSIMSATTFSG